MHSIEKTSKFKNGENTLNLSTINYSLGSFTANQIKYDTRIKNCHINTHQGHWCHTLHIPRRRFNTPELFTLIINVVNRILSDRDRRVLIIQERIINTDFYGECNYTVTPPGLFVVLIISWSTYDYHALYRLQLS